MATVINAIDPFSVASDAVGSFYDAKRKKETEDAAAAYQKARDARSDLESDRTYGLAKNKDVREGKVESRAEQEEPGVLQLQGLDIQKAQSGLTTDLLNQQKTKLDIAYHQQHDPLENEYQRLLNKHESGEILTQADTHRLNELSYQIKQIELQYAAQGKQLDAALKRAQIAEANARAYREMHPAEPKVPERERELALYNAARGSLSPQAQAILAKASDPNHPLTRAQALDLLARSHLSSGDQQNLQTVIESPEQQFESPSEIANQGASAAVRKAAAKRESDTTQHTDRNQAFEAVAKGAKYDLLPGRLKAALRNAMVDQGESVDTLLSTLDSAPADVYSDTDKQLLRAALGQLPQQQGGGGWWPFGH